MILSSGVEKALLVLRGQHEHIFYVPLEMSNKTFEVLFRPLAMSETHIITSSGKAISPYDLNEWIAGKATLYLSGLADIQGYLQTLAPAALADVIAELILSVSGFADPNNYVSLLEKSREDMQTVQANIENLICAAFPGTKPKDIVNMTIYEQMNMLARAEIILGRKLDLTPEEEKKKPGRRLSPEAAAILSQAAADKPDPTVDNRVMDPFLTGPERMGTAK